MDHPLKRIVTGLLLLAGVLLAVSFILPRNVNVARDIEIDASEADIFPHLVDLRKFNQWSPWATLDPKIRYAYSGPPSGEGAEMAWQSNNPDIGSGSLTIVRALAPDTVDVALNFANQGGGTSHFRLEPVRSGTRVTWRFYTELGGNPLHRWLAVLMEQGIGAHYEAGLKRLKALIEQARRQ